MYFFAVAFGVFGAGVSALSAVAFLLARPVSPPQEAVQALWGLAALVGVIIMALGFILAALIELKQPRDEKSEVPADELPPE
jgi:hypothetical protein